MTSLPEGARRAHASLISRAAAGEPLSAPAEIGEEDLLVARYVDDNWAAFLFIYREKPEQFEQLIEIYSRGENNALQLEASASADWYGPLEVSPPCQPLWISGFEASARYCNDAAAFVSGVATGHRYLALLRNYSSGEALSPADAPFGPFLVRIWAD